MTVFVRKERLTRRTSRQPFSFGLTKSNRLTYRQSFSYYHVSICFLSPSLAFRHGGSTLAALSGRITQRQKCWTHASWSAAHGYFRVSYQGGIQIVSTESVMILHYLTNLFDLNLTHLPFVLYQTQRSSILVRGF